MGTHGATYVVCEGRATDEEMDISRLILIHDTGDVNDDNDKDNSLYSGDRNDNDKNTSDIVRMIMVISMLRRRNRQA